jgi:hypothetical protein
VTSCLERCRAAPLRLNTSCCCCVSPLLPHRINIQSTFTVVHHTAPHIPFKPAEEWNAAKAQLSGACDATACSGEGWGLRTRSRNSTTVAAVLVAVRTRAVATVEPLERRGQLWLYCAEAETAAAAAPTLHRLAQCHCSRCSASLLPSWLGHTLHTHNRHRGLRVPPLGGVPVPRHQRARAPPRVIQGALRCDGCV